MRYFLESFKTGSFQNKKLLKKVKNQIICYSDSFSATLTSHLKTEFEIQSRDGQITPEGIDKLTILQNDFVILQYEENLKAIFETSKTFCKTSSSRTQLDIVHDRVKAFFQQMIGEIQTKVLKERRSTDNKMCLEKIQGGPVVHNFLGKDVPLKLMEHLENGLNNVLYLKPDVKLASELEEEAILACKNAFVSLMGFFPICSKKTNLNQTIIELLSQTPSNSELANSLIAFREHYVEGVQKYFEENDSNGIELKDILKSIPKDCIITQSDKNIGISLLPPSWYAKEYQTQIEKGGYEKIDMSENLCLAKLHKKILNFQKRSLNQTRILSKYWPKERPTKFRIGVLKLVPKVIFII